MDEIKFGPIETFKIYFSTPTIKSDDFNPDELFTGEDLPKIIYAESLFREMYSNFRNRWSIAIGESNYIFSIIDISYIWEELPSLLKNIINNKETDFDLLRQGVETTLNVKPVSEQYLMISVFKSSDIKKTTVVEKENFLIEWRSFIQKVIKELVDHGLIKADDPSISDYLV